MSVQHQSNRSGHKVTQANAHLLTVKTSGVNMRCHGNIDAFSSLDCLICVNCAQRYSFFCKYVLIFWNFLPHKSTAQVHVVSFYSHFQDTGCVVLQLYWSNEFSLSFFSQPIHPTSHWPHAPHPHPFTHP